MKANCKSNQLVASNKIDDIPETRRLISWREIAKLLPSEAVINTKIKDLFHNIAALNLESADVSKPLLRLQGFI